MRKIENTALLGSIDKKRKGVFMKKNNRFFYTDQEVNNTGVLI